MFALGIIVRTLITAINSTVAGSDDEDDYDGDIMIVNWDKIPSLTI